MKSLKIICIKMIERLRNGDILTTDGDNRYCGWAKANKDMIYVMWSVNLHNVIFRLKIVCLYTQLNHDRLVYVRIRWKIYTECIYLKAYD